MYVVEDKNTIFNRTTCNAPSTYSQPEQIEEADNLISVTGM